MLSSVESHLYRQKKGPSITKSRQSCFEFTLPKGESARLCKITYHTVMQLKYLFSWESTVGLQRSRLQFSYRENYRQSYLYQIFFGGRAVHCVLSATLINTSQFWVRGCGFHQKPLEDNQQEQKNTPTQSQVLSDPPANGEWVAQMY